MSEIRSILEHYWIKNLLVYEPKYNGPGNEAIGYHANGRIKFKYTIIDNNKNGLGRIWDENGVLLVEEIYRRNNLVSRKEWYSNRRLKSQENYCIERRFGFLSVRIRKNWGANGRFLGRYLYVNGSIVTGHVGELLRNRELTAKDLFTINNMEIRRACLDLFGYERFLSQAEHKVIEGGDYELIRIDWHKQEEPICLVKVRCPSMGVFYTLRVPPHMKNVKEALAWTFSLKREEYSPQQET